MDGAGAEQPSAQAAFLDAVHLPAFSAAATFNRAEHTQEVAGADLVVMGVQFDLGAVNRPGARFGPRAIRQQSIYAGALQPVYPWDEDLMGGLSGARLRRPAGRPGQRGGRVDDRTDRGRGREGVWVRRLAAHPGRRPHAALRAG